MRFVAIRAARTIRIDRFEPPAQHELLRAPTCRRVPGGVSRRRVAAAAQPVSMQEIVRPQPPQIAPTKLSVRHPARVWHTQTARLCRMRVRMPMTAETHGVLRQIAACRASTVGIATGRRAGKFRRMPLDRNGLAGRREDDGTAGKPDPYGRAVVQSCSRAVVRQRAGIPIRRPAGAPPARPATKRPPPPARRARRSAG